MPLALSYRSSAGKMNDMWVVIYDENFANFVWAVIYDEYFATRDEVATCSLSCGT